MSFTKKVMANSQLLDFNFIKAYTSGGVKYYIWVIDTHSQAYLFPMEQKKGQWQIADASHVPGWIYAVEAQLKQAIPE
jgi:hypothetical protein